MNMASVNRADLSYEPQRPFVLAGTSDAAMDRARSAIDQGGHRVAAAVPIAEAIGRLDDQASVGVVWIEVDEDLGAPMDDLLARMRRDVGDGRYGAVVATVPEVVDAVTAILGESAVDILVNPTPAERAAAMAMATAAAIMPTRVSDIAADRSGEQLRQLSEEVNRIASMLARLSDGPSAAPRVMRPVQTGDTPPVDVETVRKVIRARRLRSRYFAENLFADPAWDMLLDLLQAELSHLRVPVSSLCIAASVPATTALRWLKTMVGEGLFIRRADPHDGRRVFVELAPETRDALHRYFAEVDGVAAV